jgi:hypothetical protein
MRCAWIVLAESFKLFKSLTLANKDSIFEPQKAQKAQNTLIDNIQY